MKNSGQKNKPYYSPTDLNNFVSCKYHIKSDLLKDELKLLGIVSIGDVVNHIIEQYKDENKQLRDFINQ